MTYQTELNKFNEKHAYQEITIDGATFRYLIEGENNAPTLVFLNGGMNCSEMWMRYVDDLSRDYQVVLFDYPMECKTNQELVTRMNAFFTHMKIAKPIFIGASDGGMVAQIYTQKYPDNVGGLILISTGGMDERTLKKLKMQYFFSPALLLFMKLADYDKLKPQLVKAGMLNMPKDSDPDDVDYAKDMFETLFRERMWKEKDVAMSTLLADIMNQKPVTPQDFESLKGKILLILPDQDFFSGKMQKDLIQLMHDPKIEYISGGHLETILGADDYIEKIREFLEQLFA